MPRETAGLALGLAKPTYFYGHALWVGIPDNVEVQPRVCPRFLLVALRELVESGM